jgi:hypothetical protein
VRLVDAHKGDLGERLDALVAARGPDPPADQVEECFADDKLGRDKHHLDDPWCSAVQCPDQASCMYVLWQKALWGTPHARHAPLRTSAHIAFLAFSVCVLQMYAPGILQRCAMCMVHVSGRSSDQPGGRAYFAGRRLTWSCMSEMSGHTTSAKHRRCSDSTYAGSW